MDARDKAIALKFSRTLELHRWSDQIHVDNCINGLLNTLIKEFRLEGQRKLLSRHLKVISLDLFIAWSQSKDLYLHFGRSKSYFASIPNRYNSLNIGFKTIEVIDALISAGLIEYHKGFQDKHGFIISRYSRIKATQSLIDYLKTYSITLDDIYIRNKECIILRDWTVSDSGTYKKDVDYKDSQIRERYRNKLIAYNKLISKTHIRIPELTDDVIILKDGENRKTINHNNNFIRRIFSNGYWNQGGRFHGGWWQQVPGQIRRCIRINGSNETATEIDYSSLHIILLYALSGIDFHNSDANDAYFIESYRHLSSDEELRSLLKLILLICINAKDRKSATNAISFEINKRQEEFEWFISSDVDVEDLIDAFIDRHQPIKDYFFSNHGNKLQFIDSNMAETVINHFTKKNIPVLCIHDSFLINPLHENELMKLMVDSFKKEIKRMGIRFIPEVKLKLTTSYMDKIKEG
jgi:hypothetical protein